MILGLSLNSRTVGMAVICDGTLKDYRIRLFKERWSDDKLARILSNITEYWNEHSITHVSLLLPHRHYSNPETKTLLERLKACCKKHKLPLCCYKAKELRSLHEQSRAKKKALMQALCLLYPELSLARKKELANKKRYYAKLFEAVGAATLRNKALDY